MMFEFLLFDLKRFLCFFVDGLRISFIDELLSFGDNVMYFIFEVVEEIGEILFCL